MIDTAFNTQLASGLKLDASYPQENDVTFALNCIRDHHEGGRQEYQSEPGNTEVYNLSKKLVGSIYAENNELYLFSTNDEGECEIGLFKEGKYNPIVETSCLNFNLEYPVTGQFRIRNGCEKVIYWSDKINPDRYFNITKPEEFKSGGEWDCNKFKIAPTVLVPKLDLIKVNDSGGSLPCGSYFFQVEILDTSLNVVYTSDVTPQTPIYDESQNQGYGTIDGGLNTPQYDPTIGGIPTTTKSITISIGNLDTSFNFIRVNVFRKITATGATDGHTVGYLIPINSNSVVYTYTGYNTSAGDFPIDVSEKLIDGATYESAYVMEQVQSRLLRANLKQSTVDYSNYQQAVSAITAKWVCVEHNGTDQFDLGNAKNPNTYWYKVGYQGDEIYLPGIQFLHTNGTWSPVFPMVGRAPNNNDTQLLTVVGNTFTLTANQVWESDVDHVDISQFEDPDSPKIGNQIQTWKVFNTATVTTANTAAHPYSYEGQFAYYQTDENYPNIRDCNNNLIWGDGITENTKVRLFKFPDRRVLSHISDDGEWLRSFGFKFDNITYPDPDIIGHRFCIADRTNFDKTVVDSGWSVGQSAFFYTPGTDTIRFDGAYLNGVTGDPFIRYNSANSLYNQTLFTFDYYKMNKGYTFQSPIVASAPADYFHKTLSTDGIVYSVIQPMAAQNSGNPNRTNYLELASVLVQPGETAKYFSPIGKYILSLDAYSGDTISLLNYHLEELTSIVGTSETLTTVSGGSTTQLRVHNFYTYKKTNTIPYKSFLSRTYKYIHNNPVTLADNQTFYGGDTLISEVGTFRQYQDSNAFYAPWYKHHYEEHDLNTALRIRGTEPAFQYFRSFDDDNYNLNKSTNSAVILPRVDRIPEYYKLNTDYTVDKFQKGKVALTLQYDYCNTCQGSYPNRIIWSPKSFDEESFDLYRLNKVNDYLDLPAHRGEITGLSYQNNQLLVHTKETTFLLQPNPQQISTDQNTAYLTTGDFLSVPPQELIQTDIGMAGCQSKQSQCDTPHGHIWIDQIKGEIFTWNGKLENLSNRGLLQWFKQYLPSELKSTYYQTYETDFELRSTLSDNGVGVILYYDPRFKRLILSKKDYKPVQLVQGPVSIYPGNTYYSNGVWYGCTDPDVGFAEVRVTNPFFFENKSYTLSYSFLDESWTSWHSYIPRFAFFDGDSFYTYQNLRLYKHLHKTNYQQYYGTKYDMIVEWSMFDIQTTYNSNLYYVGFTQQWDDVNKQWKVQDKTFDRMVIYNDNQSTGLQNLTLLTNPYQNLDLSTSTKFVIKTDQNYKIAGLMDMSIGQPVMTKDWTTLQTYPSYIDKMVNTGVINFNKTYDIGYIKDKYCSVRLFFKPTEDYKKVVVLEQLNNKISKR